MQLVYNICTLKYFKARITESNYPLYRDGMLLRNENKCSALSPIKCNIDPNKILIVRQCTCGEDSMPRSNQYLEIRLNADAYKVD